MNRRPPVSGGFAGFLFNVPFGPRPVLDNPENLGQQLLERVQANHTETKGLFGKADQRLGKAETALDEIKGKVGEADARLLEIEQRMASRDREAFRNRLYGTGDHKTWGQTLIESDEFKSLAGSQDQRGRARVAVETKTLFSSTASGGALIAPDTSQVGNPVMMPRKRLVIRDLVAPGQTSGNTVHWSRQKTRTMNAAGVAEGTRKPESDITWEPMQSPVVTIAHYIKAARQTLDDAPALMSIIDSEMRYGLADKEDSQFLFGDGTGQNLLGLMGQATPFAPPFSNPAGDSAIDRLLQAIAQSEKALLPATGIVLNVVDWLQLIGFKDANGRYLSAGPFGPGNQRLLWDLPIAATTQMPQGQFLVGAFRDGAQIFDRMQATVLVATENEDDFVRNLITVLCEERLAFAVKRPDAFVKGTLEAE